MQRVRLENQYKESCRSSNRHHELEFLKKNIYIYTKVNRNLKKKEKELNTKKQDGDR